MENIYSYSAEGIANLLSELGQPRFRTKQMIQWLYRSGVRSYDEMTNLPASLRTELAKRAPLLPAEIIDRQVSADGTRKFLLRFSDGALVETVAIPSRDEGSDGAPRRLTVCFSTQVGCSMGCAFCATGTEGHTRNLLPGEIVEQVLVCQNDMGMRVSNVVAMGQGEPFLNYDAVMAALRFMNSPDGLEIGARHISISTCGIIKGIQRLAEEPEQFTLAISLHSAVQEARDRLMPRCASTPLPLLRKTLTSYLAKTNRRVSLEYLMIDGITDTDECLDALLDFCDDLLVHVNLLKINAVDGSPLKPSSPKRRQTFLTVLERHHVETTVRDSRGSDIDGACGQLKNKR